MKQAVNLNKVVSIHIQNEYISDGQDDGLPFGNQSIKAKILFYGQDIYNPIGYKEFETQQEAVNEYSKLVSQLKLYEL